MTRNGQVSLSLQRAAIEFGVSRETIRRRLAENGVKIKETYSIKEIHSALAGDLKAARTREAMANAIAKERENKIQDRELLPFSELQPWLDKRFMAIRQRLTALPGQQAQRCNPTDPIFAQTSLQSWLEETLPLLRNDLESI